MAKWGWLGLWGLREAPPGASGADPGPGYLLPLPQVSLSRDAEGRGVGGGVQGWSSPVRPGADGRGREVSQPELGVVFGNYR